MKVSFNGEQVDVSAGLILSRLLANYSIKKEAIVIELNGTILDRTLMDNIELKENDRIECIHFMSGG